MASNEKLRIRKNTGELEEFDKNKLIEALRRAGANEADIEKVVASVSANLYDGITTKKIYQRAYNTLHKLSHRSAGRYRLKKAMFQMGPSGYPFEHFIGRLFKEEGYKVDTSQIVDGKCVQHEVDLIARNGESLIMGECKFHHSENVKSDVKVSLYVNSRFEDIRNRLINEEELKGLKFIPMLITNTRFTEDALKYGICAGLKLISWDYPPSGSLKDMIDRNGLHPITSIKSLTKKEKEILMDRGFVLCRDIVEQPIILEQLNIPHRRLNTIKKEAKAILV